MTKEHWETIYSSKSPNEVSWTQEIPQSSIDLIESCKLSKVAKIIDIGGGESKQVDFLIELGYNNITVLDISKNAIKKTIERLGEKANKVNWEIADITEFVPTGHFDIWHDRAVFHFLTKSEQIKYYVEIVNTSINKNGFLIIGTFSKNGPLKCSGLDITQYDEVSLTNLFKDKFNKIECFHIDHLTPFGTIQNFIFCKFQKK